MSRLLSAGARAPRRIRGLLRRSSLVWRLRDRALGAPSGPAPAQGSLRPVVCLPTWLPWSRMRQRPQALMTAFADAGHPAFFVDPSASSAFTESGVRVVPDLGETPRRDAILYVHFAPSRSHRSLYEGGVVIYDVLDDPSIYAEGEAGLPPDRRVAQHHPALLEEADLVIAASRVLADRVAVHRHDVVLVENGVDVARFRTDSLRPRDLPSGGPVIGYHGAVARWIDVELVVSVAEARPDWRFVFVGPVLDGAGSMAERLRTVPNITLLGERPSESVPGYVQAFDVGIVPFVVDSLTEAVSPLKMFECLAAGRPVVATPLPACVGRGGVSVADSPDAFVAALEEALGRHGDPRLSAAITIEGDAASWAKRLQPALDRLERSGRQRVGS